jgi:hypothetical protein
MVLIQLCMSVFFLVSEYCLRTEMALLTVLGGEARTMVGPQPPIACCCCCCGSTTPRVTSVTPVTPGRLQDRERRRHEGTLLADLGSNLGSGAPGSGGWNVCIDVSSNILLILYPRRSSRGLLSLSFDESTFY